jgi:pilus assembly protein CpaD
MQMHPYPVALALMLALAACQQASEYTESEAPKQLKVDEATIRLDLRFAPGSDRLASGDAARLRAMAATGKLAPVDRVLVSAGGAPQVAAARVAAVSQELLPYGIVASPGALAGIGSNRAVLEAQRYLVTLPPCPNWSKPPAHDFTNTADSNFGCATVSNFGRMVANPADLVAGRPLGLAAGQPAAAAVDRYMLERVPPAPPSSISTITAPPIPPPGLSAGGGGGGGGAGAGGAGGGTGGQTGS